MSVKDIYEEPSDILRRAMPEVKEFGPTIYELLHDLRETVRQIGAVGLAANQIGVEKRVCVILIGSDRIVEFVNPVIVFKRGKAYSVEGCMSIPQYTAIIPRSLEVKVGYQTREGKAGILSLQGDYAFRAQHEIDHLNGILIRDYVEGHNGKGGGLTAQVGRVK